MSKLGVKTQKCEQCRENIIDYIYIYIYSIIFIWNKEKEKENPNSEKQKDHPILLLYMDAKGQVMKDMLCQ